MFFFGFLSFFFFFKKKLLSLLLLELCFVVLIFNMYLFGQGTPGGCSLFLMMIFLSFMVMDSVLGLCCLVGSSRNSVSLSDLYFMF